MNDTTKLERNTWKSYFDNVSRLLDGKRVEIEVASLAIGSQIAAEWLPALGVTYDEQADLLAIMAEGLDHMIRHPREVFVQTEGEELQTISVTDDDGAIQIIRFREQPAR
ncbi:hypothetical protein GTP91_33520 [Rugamonas sp. FT82W]|uniref:Uncharacterized protein n=1 Tax=Duganella vulcania TaxID=2692166 RepID=A0A845GFS4_9BURK|nr:DUF5335 family protein [Duganella vulcania]MYM92076.1 hypothetical protein [Duganella vulcania]